MSSIELLSHKITLKYEKRHNQNQTQQYGPSVSEESKYSAAPPLSCTCLLSPVAALKVNNISPHWSYCTVTKVCAVRRGTAALHPNSSPKNENSFCAYSPSFTNLRSDPTQYLIVFKGGL